MLHNKLICTQWYTYKPLFIPYVRSYITKKISSKETQLSNDQILYTFAVLRKHEDYGSPFPSFFIKTLLLYSLWLVISSTF